MDDIANQLLLVGIAVPVVGLLLWFGLKVLFLPLRLTWHLGRSLIEPVGPTALMLLLVWTVALEPRPFIYLWGWFLRFGKALLVEAPTVATVGVTSIVSACTGVAAATCGTTVTSATSQLLGIAIGRPIDAFVVPEQIARAALIFAVGVSVVVIAQQLPLSQAEPIRGSKSRSVIALGASFLLALYLSVIAIIAIPTFGESVPDMKPLRASLDNQLREGAAPERVNYTTSKELGDERKALPDITSLQSSLPPPLKGAMVPIGIAWTSQTALWDQAAKRLDKAASDLPSDARNFATTAQSFFQVSNEGRIGETASQRHVSVLVNSFNLWISDHRAALDACTVALRSNLGKLRDFYRNIAEVSHMVGDNTYDTSETIRFIWPKAAASDPFRISDLLACNNLARVDRDYLPDRIGPTETLGLFGAAAAWLLQTESPELALIIGLLGFGFFGALAASFVKEFAGTPGNELPGISFILPALIRGIGAAILVFLLAKGGTAILTRGDASPNAYAIFFACFVAAVFSEDVWSWARTNQREKLGQVKPGSPPATAPPTTPPAGEQPDPPP